MWFSQNVKLINILKFINRVANKKVANHGASQVANKLTIK